MRELQEQDTTSTSFREENQEEAATSITLKEEEKMPLKPFYGEQQVFTAVVMHSS